jgi:hypothetical protein
MRDMTNGLRRQLRQAAKKLRPPRSPIRIDTFIRMQAIQKKGYAATLEERAWLETAEARCANAPPDDLLLQLRAENEERKKADPFFGEKNAIELRLCQRVWDSCYLGIARKAGREVTPAEREQFQKFCRQHGVEPEQLSLPHRRDYGLKLLYPPCENGKPLYEE